MPGGFGLLVQQLPRNKDRVLAIGRLVGERAGDGWFTPGNIKGAFEQLRLPSPGNISQELARLKSDGLAMNRGGGSWSLTPLGRETAARLVGDVNTGAVAAEMLSFGSASFAEYEHPIILPEQAPASFAPAVRQLLEISPFERNVFCITRFPNNKTDSPDDPIGPAIDTLKRTLSEHGLTMHLASDQYPGEQLFGNVAAHIWGCKFGIALLETRNQTAPGNLNDNVLLEVGAMLVTGRRCALIKDPAAPNPPSDFVAHLYREVDIADQRSLAKATSDWVKKDLGL